MTELDNVNVAGHEILITPEKLKEQLPVTATARASVERAREQVNAVLRGEDPRLLVVVGPCSIHDPIAATEYGERLAAFAKRVDDAVLIVMRAYFEKPRSTVGWKGLINDPYLNDTFKVADGLAIARRLLLDLAELGLPLSTEALNAITPQYLQDLIAWSAIGARTSESQTHREMASGPQFRGRLQERHRRITGRGDQRDAFRGRTAPFPGHQPLRAGIRGADARQPQRSCRAARRRQGAELRCAEHRRLRAPDAANRIAPGHHGRLQPCQLEQESGDPAGRRPFGLCTRYTRAIGPLSASCSRATCMPATRRFPVNRKKCATAFQSPTVASTGPRRQACCWRLPSRSGPYSWAA